ncbi:hypothetical protein HKD37_08G022204 [Glycine soja]
MTIASCSLSHLRDVDLVFSLSSAPFPSRLPLLHTHFSPKSLFSSCFRWFSQSATTELRRRGAKRSEATEVRRDRGKEIIVQRNDWQCMGESFVRQERRKGKRKGRKEERLVEGWVPIMRGKGKKNGILDFWQFLVGGLKQI